MPKRTFQPNRRHRVKDARIPGAHEDQGRRSRAQPPPRRRPQARLGQRRIPRLSPAPAVRLRTECRLNRCAGAASGSSLPA